MKVRPLIIVFALFLLSSLLFGCSTAKEEAQKPVKEQAVEKAGTNDPTKDNPLVVDKEKGVVKIYTEANAKYFVEPTRHGIVADGGSNCDKSVLTGFAQPADFYQALIDISAKAGDNVELTSPAGTMVQGDILKVTATIDGNDYDFSELIKADSDKGWEPRFGGNLKNANEKKTGCILCLDSCSVGITSNAKYGYMEFHNNKVKFFGKQDILKEDKKPVIVSFAVKK